MIRSLNLANEESNTVESYGSQENIRIIQLNIEELTSLKSRNTQ